MKTFAKIAGFGLIMALCGAVMSFDPPNEETAIKAVIEKETDSFFGDDLPAWAACFKQDGQTVVCSGAMGAPSVTQGWDAIWRDGEAAHKQWPGSWEATVARDNWHIQQSGNLAYATFDQTVTFKPWPGKNFTKEIRCLEKVNGAWKIVALSWTQKLTLDSEMHRAAIQMVIAEETRAYFAFDFEGWAANWLHDETVAMTANNSDGSVSSITGFEAIAKAIKEGMTGEKTTFKVERGNWNFAFSGNHALVRFDQHFTDASGKTYDSKEFRVMTWTGDSWKIAQVNAFWDYKNAK